MINLKLKKIRAKIKKKEYLYKAKKAKDIKLIDLKIQNLKYDIFKIKNLKYDVSKYANIKKTRSRTLEHRYQNRFKSYKTARRKSKILKILHLRRTKKKLEKLAKTSRKIRIFQKKEKQRSKIFKQKFNRRVRKFSSNNKGFFKRFRILLRKLEKKAPYMKFSLYNKLRTKIKNHDKKEINIFLDRNVLNRCYFSRVLHLRMLKNTSYRRINVKHPKFNRTIKKEKNFYYETRKALIKTKRYLYKQQYPKIRGKKNPNFNYAYFNSIEKNGVKLILGRLVITYLHNNTFINIHNHDKMLKVISGGKTGLKGPKRATPHSRQVVMKKAVEFLLKCEVNVLDVYLNSNYSRWYNLMLKEINKPKSKPYHVRYLLISNPRPHGHIRDKKKRRK